MRYDDFMAQSSPHTPLVNQHKGLNHIRSNPVLATSRMAHSSLITLARLHSATFNEVVLRDERTGLPIQNQDFQDEWHDAIEDQKNVVIWTFPEAGKTQQITVGRTLWLLGRDPRKRYAVLSATQGAAVKIIRSIKGHIERNTILREVWPDLKRGTLWTDNAIEVERPAGIKDPSVQAYSPEGGSIQGARLDGLIIDDVLTENNTFTQYQREKITSWVRSSAFSRLSEDAFIVFLTNAWHPRDLAHELERQGWWARRYPVVTDLGELLWPERWSMERINKTRDEVLGAFEFSRQMLCKPRDEGRSRFQKAWIENCLERGEGYTTFHGFDDILENDPELAEEMQINDSILRLGGMPDGFATITGVDLAVSRKASADLSCLFTILLWPDGTRQVLEIQAGRWPGAEIIERIISVHERWRSTVVVENNAAQDFIIQWVRDRAPDLRIKAFTTGRNKLNPEYGVESLAAEMSAGMWLIPTEQGGRRTNPEINDWIFEMMNYDPKQHTGDRLMASWIAREYARALQKKRGRASGNNSRGGVTIIS